MANDDAVLDKFPNDIDVIDIRDMGIRQLSDNAFSRFTHVTHIECAKNYLNSLPKLPNTLIALFCNNNQLTSLPPLPQSLIELICGNNQLNSLPQLPSMLTTLYCANNQLTSLPPLPSTLQFLNCTNNQLTSLPPLPSVLNTLDCANNQLTLLPQLPSKLNTLDYANNPLPPEYDIIINGSKSIFLGPLQIKILRKQLGQLPPTHTVPERLQRLNSGWEFTANLPEYTETPHYLYRNNKWLIHYETYKGYDYPIITLPQGTMLYTYSRANSTPFLYNINDPDTNITQSLKFFYPVPYAAMNVSSEYTTCNIVYLHKDTRILALCAPSPVARQTLRFPHINKVINPSIPNINYYDNNFTYSCRSDLCIDPEMMKALDLQGYICIAKEDSISHGGSWKSIIDNEDLDKAIIEQFINKSCLAAIYSNHDLAKSLPFVSQHQVWGIPEIVLSPFNSSNFDDPSITIERLNDKLQHNEIAPYFNYTILSILSLDEIREYLDRNTALIVENSQMPLLHMYIPASIHDDFPFVRPMTLYSDLTLRQVDWVHSYEHASSLVGPNLCAFDTIRYQYLKAHPTTLGMIYDFLKGHRSIMGGRRCRRQHRRTKRRHKRNKGRRSRRRRSLRGGATTTAFMQTAPESLQYMPQTINKPAAIPAATNLPTSAGIAKSDTMTPVLEMTKNYIPILYWK